jgi:hypothetical protein
VLALDKVITAWLIRRAVFFFFGGEEARSKRIRILVLLGTGTSFEALEKIDVVAIPVVQAFVESFTARQLGLTIIEWIFALLGTTTIFAQEIEPVVTVPVVLALHKVITTRPMRSLGREQTTSDSKGVRIFVLL